MHHGPRQDDGTPQPAILMIVHQESSDPGRIGEMLRARGYHLDIRRPCLGQELPATMEHHDGCVVFGGPMSANDDHLDFIRSELGYDGVIITDCLTMEALSGTWPERVTAALDAGYDIALHSQGDLAASQAAAKAARPLSAASLNRIARAQQRLGRKRVDVEASHAEVERIFRENGLA